MGANDSKIQAFRSRRCAAGIQVKPTEGAIELALDDRNTGHLATETISGAAAHRARKADEDVDTALEIEGPQSCSFCASAHRCPRTWSTALRKWVRPSFSFYVSGLHFCVLMKRV